MDFKELRALQEAYVQVYEPQELDEEVEIATEYFYEMGLTEEGIGILIEELGEEEFVNWIYDIAEEYTLTEARRTGRIEPVTKGGKSIASLKGGAKTAAIARLRREKESARSSEKSSSGTSGMTSALRSQAMKSATSKQAPAKKEAPAQTKKGIGGLIGSVVQRAKQDTALLGKSIQTAKDVATRRGAEVAAGYSALRAKGKEAEQSAAATRARRKATVAAGRAVQVATPVVKKAVKAGAAAAGAGAGYLKAGKSPAAAAGRAAGTLVKKLKEENVYDVILAHLLSGGYAETVESAEAIMVNMSEEWKQNIVEGLTPLGVKTAGVVDDQRRGSTRDKDLKDTRDSLDKMKAYPKGFPRV